MSNIVIIIPTYNERENTERMILSLAPIISEIRDHSLEVLYVDGNSPDGTADIVKKYQLKYSWLQLLVETKKEGLGKAYAKGMTHAIREMGADYVMEFDADFQHRPCDIPSLVGEIDKGYDYIIGSRYISGGRISDQWGKKRKLMSRFGNIVARTVLGIFKIKDVTTGFKITRVRGFLDTFDFDSLLSKSFAYKVHILFYMIQNGAKVKEVPICFEPRVSGESKILKNEMIETLKVIMLLRYINFKTGF